MALLFPQGLASSIKASPRWRAIDFISDLHLQASESATFDAWQRYMAQTQANALFILGDLFEVWVGDDVVDCPVGKSEQAPGFEARCAQVLKAASQRLDLFFMHGNRDFLLGQAFANACGMTLLNDPCALDFDGHRWLLSHGDALCLGDTDYLQFRAQVRGAPWQQAFLAKPLAERQAIARSLRSQSDTRKRSGVAYADVDNSAACDWLNAAQARTLIHGHTHHPADHLIGKFNEKTMRRLVLSDWDVAAKPPRAEILRLSLDATQSASSPVIQRLPAALCT